MWAGCLSRAMIAIRVLKTTVSCDQKNVQLTRSVKNEPLDTKVLN